MLLQQHGGRILPVLSGHECKFSLSGPLQEGETDREVKETQRQADRCSVNKKFLKLIQWLLRRSIFGRMEHLRQRLSS